MKLLSLYEEVVRSVCAQCHKPLGQKVVAPSIGGAATTGTQTKEDDTGMCPECAKKMDVDKPFNSIQDRTSDALAQVRTPPGGPQSAPEAMPTGRIANQFKPML